MKKKASAHRGIGASGHRGIGGGGISFRMGKHAKRGFVVMAAASMAVLCGCYERTVSAKGLGAKNTVVQEGYRSNTALDRAWDSLFADPAESKPVPRNTGIGK